ncbi:MAG TPA: IclR family transcriptional regulator [Zeimonas sp.]|nr:IclR family transcriptional regulator [Zeimonas sp.]
MAARRAAVAKGAARKSPAARAATPGTVPPQPGASERQAGSVAARALTLLAEIAQHPEGVSLHRITMQLGWPKPSVHRLCAHLEQAGWILRAGSERNLSLGPSALKFALAALQHDAANAERRAILRALVDRVGETCNLTMLAGAEVLYVDRVESAWPLRLHLEPGSRVPLHCTASGKLFLAHMPKEQRARLLAARPLWAATPNTLTDAADIEKEARAIVRQGYSVDREEFLLGLIAIAVPVPGRDGAPVAALAIHAPIGRLSLKRAIELLPVMREAADALGGSLPA